MFWLRALGSVVVVLGAMPASLQKTPSWQRDVDRVFAAYDRRDSPGCAAAIYNGGKIAYERGYGMADLEHDVPITPATVFYAGSVSKQFTAFAAALAIQQGKLGLDDPIRKHLPELPAYANGVTVRHLVHHTSGLRDFYTLLSIAGQRQDALFDNAAILRQAARQTALNFPPGTEYLYSNTGYALLATLVGRAVGTSFGQFTQDQIFEPLGMTATRFGDDASRLVPGRAYGYTWGARGEPRLDTPGGERVGAGGVFTTVRDLLRWDENFYSGKVGGKALIEQVQTPGALNDGKALTYAWGLQIGTYRGLRVVEHSGALGGYRAHLARYPEQHVGIAVLCNVSAATPSIFAQQMADVVVGDRFPQLRPRTGSGGTRAAGAGTASPPVNATDPTAEHPPWDEIAGTYVSDELNATVEVVVLPAGHALLRRDDGSSTLQPIAHGRFRAGALMIRFERGKDGKIDALLVDAGRVRDIRFRRRP